MSNEITSGTWYFQDFEPGDSSVGLPDTPPHIYAEIPLGEDKDNPDFIEAVVIANLEEPRYQLPRSLWTENDHRDEKEGMSDYPPGTRFDGDAAANGEYIVAAVNACRELGLTAEALKNGVLKALLQCTDMLFEDGYVNTYLDGEMKANADSLNYAREALRLVGVDLEKREKEIRENNSVDDEDEDTDDLDNNELWFEARCFYPGGIVETLRDVTILARSGEVIDYPKGTRFYVVHTYPDEGVMDISIDVDKCLSTSEYITPDFQGVNPRWFIPIEMINGCPYCGRTLESDQAVCDSDDCPRHNI